MTPIQIGAGGMRMPNPNPEPETEAGRFRIDRHRRLQVHEYVPDAGDGYPATRFRDPTDEEWDDLLAQATAAARAEVARQVREYLDQLDPVVPVGYGDDPKQTFEAGFGWGLEAITDYFNDQPWVGGKPWITHGLDGKPLPQPRPPAEQDAAPEARDIGQTWNGVPVVRRTDLTPDSDPAHDLDGPDPFSRASKP